MSIPLPHPLVCMHAQESLDALKVAAPIVTFTANPLECMHAQKISVAHYSCLGLCCARHFLMGESLIWRCSCSRRSRTWRST
jgi:hypothetical protein